MNISFTCAAPHQNKQLLIYQTQISFNKNSHKVSFGRKERCATEKAMRGCFKYMKTFNTVFPINTADYLINF